MSAVRTNLTAGDLPDDLSALRSAIEAAIPVGFSAHDDPVNPHRVHGLPTAGWDRFWAGFGALHADVPRLKARASRQLGSLDGGCRTTPICRTGTWRFSSPGHRRWPPTGGT
jgi:tRNA-splicing ligase RtcB